MERNPQRRLGRASFTSSTSGIPGVSPDTALPRAALGDSYTEPRQFKAFQQGGQYIGAYEAFGGTISNKWRLFYSTREPVGVWWVVRVAHDLWDNWFRVKNRADKDDESLDDQVQKALLALKARQQLPRETVFERRYGTTILLLSYTGFGDDVAWETPLYELDSEGKPPPRLGEGQRLLQITPYPLTSLTINEIDADESSTRCGLPLFYTITRGAVADSSAVITGTQKTGQIRVHWTRVIHDAPRLDEHEYLGTPAGDAIFDDLVGGRNARWAAYEAYYRKGTGFPVVKSKGTAEQNAQWIANGGLSDYLNVRGYFVCHVDEDFYFASAQEAIVNPNTYFDMYFTFIAAATGVAKDTIQGVSAGRVTGSEVNERQYYKSISLHQNQKEPMLRELIDRLIQTGQVDFDGEYEVEWVDPFEVNPQDKAAIEFIQTRKTALESWKTINEIRKEKGLPPIKGGDVLMLQPGQFGAGGLGGQPTPNQQEPERAETEPEEGTPNESTLLDRAIRTQ